MPANGDWQAAHEMTLTIGADTIPAESVEYQEQAGEFDATNLESGSNDDGLLYTEVGFDTITHTIRATMVVKRGQFKAIRPGLYLQSTLAIDSEETHAGKLAIRSRSKVGGSKGAYKVSVEGVFTGAVTTQATP